MQSPVQLGLGRFRGCSPSESGHQNLGIQLLEIDGVNEDGVGSRKLLTGRPKG